LNDENEVIGSTTLMKSPYTFQCIPIAAPDVHPHLVSCYLFIIVAALSFFLSLQAHTPGCHGCDFSVILVLASGHDIDLCATCYNFLLLSVLITFRSVFKSNIFE